MALISPLKAGYSLAAVLSNGTFSRIAKGDTVWAVGESVPLDVWSLVSGAQWTVHRQDIAAAIPSAANMRGGGQPAVIGGILVAPIYGGGYVINSGGWQYRQHASPGTHGTDHVVACGSVFVAWCNSGDRLLGTYVQGPKTSSDGITWSSFLYSPPADELGGATYTFVDAAYSGGTYYALVYARTPTATNYLVVTSSDLTTWTEHFITTGLSNAVGDTSIVVSGSYVYAGRFKSSDLTTWTDISNDPLAKTTFGLMIVNQPLGDGFIRFTAFSQLGDTLSYLTHAKNNITSFVSAPVDASSGVIATLGMRSPPVIFNNYVYLAGQNVWAFRYEPTWDDGSLEFSGTLQPTSSPDTAVIQGSFSAATGSISGTLRLDTSTGVFAARTVYLYSYTTGAKIAETTSNGSTGVWTFTAIAPGEYFVVGVAQAGDLTIPRDFDALGAITVT